MGSTLGEVVAEVAQQFGGAGLVFGHGTDNAWDEAVALVLGALGCPDDEAYLGQALTQGERTLVAELAERRVQHREPVAYLIGKAQYSGHEFLCEAGVVIPRSPISQLIAQGLRPWLRDAPHTVADVCCGTGCLGILCGHVFPQAVVTLLDIEPQAAALAQRNVDAHGLADRVEVGVADLLAQPHPTSFDLIVSNPPYVDAADFAVRPAEFRHEPDLGLAGGADGLDVVTRLMEQAARCLATDGLLICEVGASAPALIRRFPRMPFVWPDLPDGGEGIFVLDARALAASSIGHRA